MNTVSPAGNLLMIIAELTIIGVAATTAVKATNPIKVFIFRDCLSELQNDKSNTDADEYRSNAFIVRSSMSGPTPNVGKQHGRCLWIGSCHLWQNPINPDRVVGVVAERLSLGMSWGWSLYAVDSPNLLPGNSIPARAEISSVTR